MRDNPQRYYVYVYFRLNGEPCYVGKGEGSRWLAHERSCTNTHLWRIIQESGGTLPKVKVREALTDFEAKEIEKALIRAIGRQDLGLGPLVNFTDGGEGENPSRRQREKIRQARLGTRTSAETRKKQADAKLADPENRVRLAKARSQIGPETPERAKRRKEGQERRWESFEARERAKNQRLGKKASKEAVENQIKAQAARSTEAEVARREKIKAAALAQWARFRAQKSESLRAA